MEHAPAPPSGLERTLECAGHISLEALYPEDESSEEAREGTAAHWALAEMLHGRAIAEGQITPDGFVITPEMVQGAELMIDKLRDVIAKHPGEECRMLVEQRVETAGRIHTQCWGTLDVALIFARIRLVYEFDYKFGHRPVDAFENPQLLAYLAGILNLLQLGPEAEASWFAVLGVVQPRSYSPEGPVRTWSFAVTNAVPHWARIARAVDSALAPEPMASVNPHCGDCRARHACPALHETGTRGMDRSKRAVPFNLPPLALGIELAQVRAAIKALTARETGLAGQAEALLSTGTLVPFWALAREPGRLAWTKPAAEVLALGKMMGVELQKPPEPITPTQAKVRGLDAGVLAAYAERPAGAAKLTMLDDKDARRIFAAPVDGTVN